MRHTQGPGEPGREEGRGTGQRGGIYRQQNHSATRLHSVRWSKRLPVTSRRHGCNNGTQFHPEIWPSLTWNGELSAQRKHFFLRDSKMRSTFELLTCSKWWRTPFINVSEQQCVPLQLFHLVFNHRPHMWEVQQSIRQTTEQKAKTKYEFFWDNRRCEAAPLEFRIENKNLIMGGIFDVPS